MDQVRYTQRNVTDQKKIDTFLLQARIGVLGLSGGTFPYAVPMNFVWHNGYIYLHGMGSGKKENILAQAPLVWFYRL